MPRFRTTRPVVVEAVRFDPTGDHRFELPEGVIGYPSSGADNWGYWGCCFFIETPDGRLSLRPGDWIITGAGGERSVCEDRVFRTTYEPEIGP